jgi:predicted dehydrogenase
MRLWPVPAPEARGARWTGQRHIPRGLAILAALLLLPLAHAQEPLKLGIIGLDTSHVIRFSELLNDPSRKDRVPGAVIVAAFKGGSPTIPESADRIEGFTQEATTKYHVKLAASIPELCGQVDAVLILSVDGRQHLEQVRPVFAAKKRVFIDKPLAGSLRDAKEIAKLSRESGVPFFSCSSERFTAMVLNLKNDPGIGHVEGAITFGPSPLAGYLPDLFWYGIHSVEMLYALMGPGCERVARVHTEGADSVVGTWKEGRIGEIRGLRSSPRTYGAVVFGSKKVAVSGNLANPAEKEPANANYHALVEEIVKFFHTGNPPVPNAETLEVLAFMEAADLSRRRNGAPVALREVMEDGK